MLLYLSEMQFSYKILNKFIQTEEEDLYVEIVWYFQCPDGKRDI